MFNHNYNKILKSDWLSAVLISALIGQCHRTWPDWYMPSYDILRNSFPKSSVLFGKFLWLCYIPSGCGAMFTQFIPPAILPLVCYTFVLCVFTQLAFSPCFCFSFHADIRYHSHFEDSSFEGVLSF